MMTDFELTKIYNSNKLKFENVINYISMNKHLKKDVDYNFNSNVLINNDCAKEKLRLIFIDTLNAAGGSNLTRNGIASECFHSKIESLNNTAQVNLADFYNCFDKSIKNATDLYNYLRLSTEIINFGDKKSALFIYKIHKLQTILNENQKIFTNYNVELSELIIPIDVVITLVLNKVFNLTDKNKINQYKDFELINTFFKKQLGNDFLLIEDLWFWGYFTTIGSGENRDFNFNKAKFYTANFIKPINENKKYFLDFLEILNS